MTKPVYKIEIYDTAPSLVYTVTDEAASIRVKEVLTDNIGTFSFTLPTKKNGSGYLFNDVAVGYTAKIWLGYNSVSGNPLTKGTIHHISAPLSTESGYARTFLGRNQGEIGQRRFKTKRWETTEASTIVTELATDLGWGTSKIEATSGKSITLQVEDKKYWDILREISDYWISGASQISKDFYVDFANDLVWKDRPFRTSGVETLTVGDNILSYFVTRNMAPIFNKIKVYGATEKTWSGSVGKDGWTESTTNWTSIGTVTADTSRKHGSYSIKTTRSTAYFNWLRRASLGSVKCKFKTEDQYPYLVFSLYWNSTLSSDPYAFMVNLYAPDSDNGFVYTYSGALGKTTPPPSMAAWQDVKLPLGPHHEVPDARATGWVEGGSADWEDIRDFYIYIGELAGSGTIDIYVDGLHFYGAPFHDIAEDSGSQTNYGVREAIFIDRDLQSDGECEKRAEALITRYKDPATQIELLVVGNTNVLIGDRLSMTVPAENISSVNFDVISVEHFFSDQGFVTKAVMNSSAKQRRKDPTSLNDLTVQLGRQVKEALRTERVLS